MIHVPIWLWIGFGALVLVLLGIDLFAHRGRRESRHEAVGWSVAWIAAALLFAVVIVVVLGPTPGEEFLSAYLLEKSLSIDNLFVFLLVFSRLGIPARQERRVLTWGILGAIVTRGIFIALGAAVLERWRFVTYLFGAALVVSGLKMLRNPQKANKEGDKGRLMPWLQRHIPFTPRFHQDHFVVREEGRLLATPLLLALITIELTDVVFAVDSIPAAFSVTEQPFIVYSSNVFAVLGLRALYIVIAQAARSLEYLYLGLAAVLLFAGGKMLAAQWIEVPPLASLGIIAFCIGAATVASVVARRARAGAARSAT